LMSPECRLPLSPMSQPNEEQLRKTLAALEQTLG